MNRNKTEQIIEELLWSHSPSKKSTAKIKESIAGPDLYKTYRMVAVIFDKCFKTSFCLPFGN